jgi:uncharacterized phiE125 gp8 family phage protein
MALELVTAPAEDIITLDDVRLHLRLDAEGSPPTHPDDPRLERLIASAQNLLDGKDGFLGLCLVTQTWDYFIDGFADQIILPLAPVQSITSITYVDENGATQTLSSDVYSLKKGDPGVVVKAFNKSWPSVRAQPDAVKIRFVAGFGDVAAVPARIKEYALAFIQSAYENGSLLTPMNLNATPFVRDMLQTFRVGM